jgi:hypothetical protein
MYFMYLVRICMHHVCIGTYQTVSVCICMCVCILFCKRLTGAFSLLVPAGEGNPWKCTAARMHTICASGACANVMDPMVQGAPCSTSTPGPWCGQMTSRRLPTKKWVLNKGLHKVCLCALVDIFSAPVQLQGTWLVCFWCNTKIYCTNTCK